MFITPVPESESTDDLADYTGSSAALGASCPITRGRSRPDPDVAQAWNLLTARSETPSTGAGSSWPRLPQPARSAPPTAPRHTRSSCATFAATRDAPGARGRSERRRPRRAGPGRLRIATKVATDAASVVQADIDRLREIGLSDGYRRRRVRRLGQVLLHTGAGRPRRTARPADGRRAPGGTAPLDDRRPPVADGNDPRP